MAESTDEGDKSSPPNVSLEKNLRQPNPFIVQPTSDHTHTAIFLHGLGSNGEKFGAELIQSGISSRGATLTATFPGMKFIFPTARKRRSSAFKRATLNQWFDIASLKDPMERNHLQVDGLIESADYIRSIISQEMKAIPSQNILLGGLSQGCAMAFFVLLSIVFSIGGFVGMSGWLPFYDDFDEIVNPLDPQEADSIFSTDKETINADNDPFLQTIRFVRDLLSLDGDKITTSMRDSTCFQTPVFLGHGGKDEKIDCQLSEDAANLFKSLGMDVSWKCYPELGHWYKIPEEIDDIEEFLQKKAGFCPTDRYA